MNRNEQTVNTFLKGMNKDISENLIQNDTYKDARNIRLTSKEYENSLGGVSNIKGTELSFSFSTIYSVFKGELDIELLGYTDTYSVRLDIKTVNGPVISQNISGYGGQSGFFERIKELCNTSSSQLYSLGIQFYTESSTIYKITSTTQEIETVEFFNAYMVSSTPISQAVSYILKQTEFAVMGSINIKSDMYVFTCSPYQLNEGGVGQIWKLTYNISTLVYDTPVLLLNEQLNVSLLNHITGVGIYENEKTSRIYWTDNVNPVRSLNVSSNNTFEITSDLLALQPSSESANIYIKQISTGGILKTGVYQYAYRLKKDNGVTKPSLPTNVFPLLKASDTIGKIWGQGNDSEISGNPAGEVTGKSILIQIDNLDTKYDEVELICIYRTSKNAIPTVYSVETTEIPSSKTIVFTHSGNENVLNMAIEELNIFGQAFITAKCLAVKDNSLFAANITTSTYKELQFNARAYRFKISSTDTYPSITDKLKNGYDSQDPNWGIDPFADTTSTSEKDAINPNQDLYSYVRDSSILGGSGPNVRYEFVQNNNISASESLTFPDFEAMVVGDLPTGENIATYFDNPSSNQLDAFGDLILDNPYVDYAKIDNFKSPYITSVLKGYASGETYRFGIVLFDKANTPSFVNWIGDIKIPNILPGAGSRLNTCGISFSVDITSIKDQINGFSIVRVERKPTDRTVLGSGMITPLIKETYDQKDAPDGQAYMFYTDGYGLTSASDSTPFDDNKTNQFFTIDSPDFQLDDFSPVGNEYITPLCGYLGALGGPMNNGLASSSIEGYNGDMNVKKYVGTTFTTGENINKNLPIVDSIVLSPGESNTLVGENVINYSRNNGTRHHCSIGTKTLAFKLNTPITMASLFPTDYVSTKLESVYVSYRRNLAEQYGGATEYARSLNVFIPCSYTRVDKDTNTEVVFTVFNGDVQPVMYGNTKFEMHEYDNYLKIGSNINLNQGGNQLNNPRWMGEIFPVESRVCAQYRTGYHLMNKVYSQNVQLYPKGKNESIGDEYTRNSLYEAENNIFQFITKPSDSNLNFVKKFENRIYGSDTKIAGETIDAWRIFKSSVYIDLDNNKGEINGLIPYSTYLVSFQREAVSLIRVNPVSSTVDDSGNTIVLGKGGLLDSYKIVEENKGIIHRNAYIQGESGIYFFDGIKRKFHILGDGGVQTLSDTKGMSSYFNNLEGSFRVKDVPLLGEGVNMAYDFENRECLLTITSKNTPQFDTGKIVVYQGKTYVKLTHGHVMPLNTRFLLKNNTTGEITYFVIDSINTSVPTVSLLLPKDQLTYPHNTDITLYSITNTINDTLSFSEEVGAFVSYYDFVPACYLNNKVHLFSTVESDIHIHNKGTHNTFYGTYYPSTLRFVVNPQPGVTKMFDNLHLDYSVYNEDNIQNPTFELGDLRIFNKIQNTGLYSPLTTGPYKQVKKVENEWRTLIRRDSVVNPSLNNLDETNILLSPFAPRIRSKYAYVDMIFNKVIDNSRFFLGYVKTLYGLSER